MYDMHVHTFLNSDCDETFEAYINNALTIGVKSICFTEHVDYNPNDYGLGYYDSTAFFKAFNRHKEETKSIDLLAGIEFDCPHRFQRELSELVRLPYDCVIGSVHYCDLVPDLFFPDLINNGVPAEVCFAAYWEEVLKCVSLGGFDVLGHIDIPKRYYHDLMYEEPLLREIFRTMLKNNIVLEINTSSLRYGLVELMPGTDILKLYCDEGGKYVTIGSDAHIAADLAADYAIARDIAKELDLHEVIFVNRKMILIK